MIWRLAYYAVVAPLGFLVRRKDPLRLRSAPTATNWTPIDLGAETIEQARRQS